MTKSDSGASMFETMAAASLSLCIVAGAVAIYNRSNSTVRRIRFIEQLKSIDGRMQRIFYGQNIQTTDDAIKGLATHNVLLRDPWDNELTVEKVENCIAITAHGLSDGDCAYLWKQAPSPCSTAIVNNLPESGECASGSNDLSVYFHSRMRHGG
jgi:hypothetical protein